MQNFCLSKHAKSSIGNGFNYRVKPSFSSDYRCGSLQGKTFQIRFFRPFELFVEESDVERANENEQRSWREALQPFAAPLWVVALCVCVSGAVYVVWWRLLVGLNLLAFSSVFLPPCRRDSKWFGVTKAATIFIASLSMTVFTTTTLNSAIDDNLLSLACHSSQTESVWDVEWVLFCLLVWLIGVAPIVTWHWMDKLGNLFTLLSNSYSELRPSRVALLIAGALAIILMMNVVTTLFSQAADPTSYCAVHRLENMAHAHAARIFQDYDKKVRLAKTRATFNLGPTLYWCLLYGDVDFGESRPESYGLPTVGSGTKMRLKDLKELKAKHGWRTLTSPRLFGDGQFPSQPFREISTEEPLESKDTASSLQVPHVPWMNDGISEPNLAMDFSSGSKYVYHYIALYLRYLHEVHGLKLKTKLKRESPGGKDAGIQVTPGDSEADSKDGAEASPAKPGPPQEPEEENEFLTRLDDSNVWQYVPARHRDKPWFPITQKEQPETGDSGKAGIPEADETKSKHEAIGEPLKDDFVIKEVLDHIRKNRSSPNVYRLPFPLPFGSPYVARQWFNGTIQIWTQLLFWCGVLAALSQLRAVVSEWNELDVGLEIRTIFQRDLNTYKLAVDKFDLRGSLKDALERHYSAKRELWGLRHLFFVSVNFVIPLLGLLGTVAGISGAFDKAPAFVRAGGNQLAQEGAMALLATSVSIAFFTTLVACYLAIVFYLIHKTVSAVECAVLRRLAQRCQDCIAMAVQFSVVPKSQWAKLHSPVKDSIFEAFTGTEIAEWERRHQGESGDPKKGTT